MRLRRPSALSPQNAAEYVRLNVLPRAAAAATIGRPDDVERQGEVAVAAEGVGGAFGYLGGLAEGAAALAPTAGEVAGARVSVCD